jgi:succinate dehydrogenase/fumarate reductase flavoprotein subunit
MGRKVRSMGVEVMDHFMVTRLLKGEERIAGCVGFNVLDGTFTVIRAKKVVLAFGSTASRAWDNSTGNPYNIWFCPYNTGSHFVLSYEAGVKLLNIDIHQMATLIPKGFGAPGMNGINSMGGRELNALGERFMGKYDPMWENGLRINQISGTYQELIEGKGPPFYMDMTHFDKEEVHHLQYVLMPGDKATYTDYCEQRGIDFATAPLEVEISELSFGGLVLTQDNFETNLSGLYNGCVFFAFSGAMCGGYYAGLQAGDAAGQVEGFAEIDHEEILREKARIYSPMQVEDGISYQEFEHAVRQVMNYYMGYRRNQQGMEQALDRLQFLKGCWDQVQASDHRSLMRANESAELVRICQIATQACLERKESGRAFYRRTDYPEMNPDLNRPMVIWEEKGEQKFSWGLQGPAVSK